MMDMIYAGTFQKEMQEHERKLGTIKVATEQEHEFKKIISDVTSILGQFGYEKGAEILNRMVSGEEK